jgi:hypothetical protein
VTPTDPRVPWLRRAVWAVLLAGVLTFLLRGADGPADPVLGPPAAEATP